jgi:secreted trypsin-like serine protease
MMSMERLLRLRRFGFASILALLLLAGSACAELDSDTSPEPGAYGAAESSIVGGQLEDGYAAVGAFVYRGDAFCTGTLVSPRVVVTAAHCLEDGVRGTSFYFGRDVNGSGGYSIPVEAGYLHPDYRRWAYHDDIAVAWLAEPSDATPIALPRRAMNSGFVGEEALFVGYGVTRWNRDDTGRKRSVWIPITSVRRDTFRYGGDGVQTCGGDSGGPTLIYRHGQTRLYGVTSWGDARCQDFGVNTRVDRYRSFIQPFIDEDWATL